MNSIYLAEFEEIVNDFHKNRLLRAINTKNPVKFDSKVWNKQSFNHRVDIVCVNYEINYFTNFTNGKTHKIVNDTDIIAIEELIELLMNVDSEEEFKSRNNAQPTAQSQPVVENNMRRLLTIKPFVL